jgi:DNA mismatch endonuclease (patch repair protein)
MPVSGSKAVLQAPTPAVSAQMKRMRRANTAPELALRKALTVKGLRYRLHRRDLPGTPDIAFISARVAVFVDGCFWHACPKHAVTPKANREWWQEKLDANRARDARKDQELVDAGWLPVHVWEHEDPNAVADRLVALVASRVSPRQR